MTAEQTYFTDPQTDRLVSLVWQLAAELNVTRQRLAAMEALLVRSGTLAPNALDGFRPSAQEEPVLAAQRDALLDRLMRVVTEYGPAEHPMRDQWHAKTAPHDS